MGFLDRAIQRGIGNAVSGAVEKGVRQAVEPKIEKAAANAVNSAANQINQAVGTPQPTQQSAAQPRSNVNSAEVTQAANTLGGLFGSMTSAATSFANEAAKNMKICPSCNEPAGADVKFCPKCGGPMPAETMAQGAVCPSCGKQNSIGTKFCQDCGTKLPAAVAEEQEAQASNDAVMTQWDEMLSAYPKWSCGGTKYNLESNDRYVMFETQLENGFAAQNAVKQYREILLQSGFRQAGQYPDICHLYKMTDGVCYHVDTEHCFDGNDNAPSIYFNTEEPSGGFNYVKPEPKKPMSLRNMLGL